MTRSKNMPLRKPKVTQGLIAKEAGVSQTLVSLVLNNASSPERVADETRKRILETARALGYQIKGSGLRKKTLALILPMVSRAERLDTAIYASIEDFYARTQKFVTEAAYRKGYSLIVRFCDQPAELTHWLTEWEVDGVLWNASDEKLLEWISQRFPTAQLHFGEGSAPIDLVTANQEEIPSLALDFLHKRGHRRICFVPGVAWGRVTEIRAAACRQRAKALGVTVYDQFLKESDVASSWDILSDCLRLMELPASGRPTAFVLGDPAALPLARELQKRGFAIPKDVSIMGIDNLSAGNWYNPPLTSIDVCQREVSEAAVAMVVARIANPDQRCQKVFISPEVVERESVADITSEAGVSPGADVTCVSGELVEI